jgi:hypothetical protein
MKKLLADHDGDILAILMMGSMIVMYMLAGIH